MLFLLPVWSLATPCFSVSPVQKCPFASCDEAYQVRHLLTGKRHIDVIKTTSEKSTVSVEVTTSDLISSDSTAATTPFIAIAVFVSSACIRYNRLRFWPNNTGGYGLPICFGDRLQSCRPLLFLVFNIFRSFGVSIFIGARLHFTLSVRESSFCIRSSKDTDWDSNHNWKIVWHIEQSVSLPARPLPLFGVDRSALERPCPELLREVDGRQKLLADSSNVEVNCMSIVICCVLF